LLLGAVLDRDAAPVVDACRAEGLLVLSAGADVLRLTPPLVISAGEVEEALDVIGACVASALWDQCAAAARADTLRDGRYR
jgi:acetylornithine/succinyldiaminopimelate/putrescine aminotransferase